MNDQGLGPIAWWMEAEEEEEEEAEAGDEGDVDME
jgi:hypothetical protein